MIPGFRLFLRIRTPAVGTEGRAFWENVSSLTLDSTEQQALDRVEATRHRLERDARRIDRIDFGVGPGGALPRSAKEAGIGQLARKASISSTWGRLLFKIARVARSSSILELGSCVGISAAYLQVGLDLNGGGVLVTMEGDPKLCLVARDTLESVSRNPGKVIEGRFADKLPSVLEKHDPFDLVFIDGHHDPRAVETYLSMIGPRLAPGAIVIIDDVQPLLGAVRPAWKTIVRSRPTSWSIDLVRMGVFRLTDTQ